MAPRHDHLDAHDQRDAPGTGDARETGIAIVGAGFSGIGAAVRLELRGIDDFVVLERASDVGGTWRDNAYPGCACDVQSHLYSYSFAPNPHWSRAFSPQGEIWDYLRRVARDRGVLPHVRLGHAVLDAAWDDDARRWRIETTRGRFTARMLVMAQGFLSDPAIPAIPGLDRFRGAAFHSARWDHDVDLAGKRVAVVGTGASAIQFVPRIQPRVARLHLFQRTPPWILPHHDRALRDAERRLFRALPLAQRAARAGIYLWRELFLVAFRHPRLARQVERVALRHLERSVPDPALRAKLTPGYTIFCKRVLISNDYLPALTRPNVEVVTDAIVEVREHSVVTADGTEREVDAIIFGTGFRPTTPPLADHVRGRGGRTLAAAWAGRPRAHLGTSVPGFPNLFMLMGPNTGLGHTSVLYTMEAQLDHLLGALDHLRRASAEALEPRPEAQAAWQAEVERRTAGTVWVAGGCRSWYLDATGHNAALWPDFTWRFRRRVARFRPADYETLGAPAASAAAPALATTR